MSKDYDDYRAELKAEQKDLSKDEIMDAMSEKSEYAVDLNELPKLKHNWIERGIKVSCEGAGHPHHSHFLPKR